MNNYIFTEDWFSSNVNNFINYLEEFKGKPNLNFLEIGSYQGRSSVWLFENILTEPTCKLTCIDTFEGSVEHTEHQKSNLFEIFNHNIREFSNRVHIIRGYSQQMLRRLEGEYDFIYIDGDHRASSVLEDAILSFSLLKKGGIMIFDDYEWGEPPRTDLNLPKQGIDAFLNVYSDKYEILLKAYQVVIRKL